MRSLVLIGRGSHSSPELFEAIHTAADWLREQANFGEVVAAFWLGEPSLRQVLKTVQFTDVTVIPLLLEEGELSETVIPRELGLGHQGAVPPQGITRVLSGLTVHYTRPYGTHAATQQLINQYALEVLDGEGPDVQRQTALYLVTDNGNAGNRLEVMRAHAQALRQSGMWGAVEVLALPETQMATSTPFASPALPAGLQRVVAVPFMEALSATQAQTLSGRLRAALALEPQFPLHCTQALGQHPAAAQVAAQVAAQARTPLGGDLERGYQERWGTVLALSRQPLRIGEALISPHGELLEVRHALDEGRHSDNLTTLVTLAGLRQQVRRDAAGHFRPLASLRTLPRGWRAVTLRRELPQVLQTLYPGAVEESFAHHHHALRATPWAATARRQSGPLAPARRATPQQVEQAAARLCSGCLKTRIWAGEGLHQTFFGGVPGAMPCAEACSVLVAAVCEQVTASS